VLGFGSDRGGRKIIILACIWTTGIMSIFQMVGTDYMSFIFFQFFVGLFLGGIQAAFLPAIVEMFPIKMR
jgi:MFS family permease